MDLNRRSNVMRSKDPETIYILRDLICDGATAYETDFKPFYDDKDTDFKITIRFSNNTVINQAVILGCKYEGTISGQQYPGLYVRYANGNKLQIGGFNYWQPTVAAVTGKNLYIWRKGGSWYGQIDGDASPTSLSVRVAEFNQPIVLGAGVQTNGTKFRYSTCTIDYIRIEYI